MLDLYRQKSYLHLDLLMTDHGPFNLLFMNFNIDCEIQKWRKQMCTGV